MTIQIWVPAISEMERISRAVTFFRPKGEEMGLLYIYIFANTPDMQCFKGMFPPTLSFPLRNFNLAFSEI